MLRKFFTSIAVTIGIFTAVSIILIFFGGRIRHIAFMAKWNDRGINFDVTHDQKPVSKEDDFLQAPGIVDWVDNADDDDIPDPAAWLAMDRLYDVIATPSEFSRKEAKIIPASLNVPTSSQREIDDILSDIFARDEVFIKQLHDAVHRPDSQRRNLIMMGRLNDFSKYMGFRAYSEIAAGDTEAGVREFTTSMRLPVKISESSANLVAMLVEQAILGITSDFIWASLQLDDVWDDASLVSLEAECRRIQLTKSLPEKIIRMIASEDIEIRSIARTDAESATQAWFMENLMMQHLVTSHSLFADGILWDPDKNAPESEFHVTSSKRLGKRCLELRGKPILIRVLSQMAVPNLGRIGETILKNQQIYEMAAIACRLKRHNLKSGEYPVSLGQLDIASPRDLFNKNGKLKYSRDISGSFKLYSVGYDEVDNGGNPDTDLVWLGHAVTSESISLLEVSEVD